MHRNAMLATSAAALSLALTACGGSEPEPATSEPEPTVRAMQDRTDEPTAAPVPFPEAADGEDYDACFDGECEVHVTVGSEIEFDGDFRVPTTTVEAIGDSVTVVARDSSGYLSFELGKGGTGNFQNTLNVQVVAIREEEAVLKFWPGEYQR
jgi:hypothetical protein